MKPVFCFIDDAKFELENFAANAAWAFERADFAYAYTFEGAQEALGGRRPLCFLLDLYGCSQKSEEIQIPDLDAMAQWCPEGMELMELYSGLEGELSEVGNLFLRRLHSRVQGWQDAFGYAAASLGQSPEYGLNNLKAVRRHYPWAAAIGYSRKALYADAALLSQTGLEGFMQKPLGAGDAAIARATREAAPILARTVYAAVEQRLRQQAGLMGLHLAQQPESMGLASALYRGLQGRAAPAELANNLDSIQNIDHIARQTILSLADWLETRPGAPA